MLPPEPRVIGFSIGLTESRYLGQLGLLGMDVVRCPGDPLLQADVAVVADLAEHLGSVKCQGYQFNVRHLLNLLLFLFFIFEEGFERLIASYESSTKPP